jgi:mRNA interferase MazF
VAYHPKQGDIVRICLNPTVGREQQGERRPVVIASNADFNKFGRGMAMICPITNTNKGISLHIPLDSRTKTTGVVLCDQSKTVDLTKRNAQYVEAMPKDLVRTVCNVVMSISEFDD